MSTFFYKLNNTESKCAEWIGSDQQQYAQSSGFNDHKIDGSQSGVDIQVEGSGAEFAFAKIHGIYPNFHEGGPIKFDFVIDGMRVDVKSTKYTSGNLLLPLKLTLANSAEAFALMRGTISDGFDYAGWVTAEEYFAKAEKRDLGWGLTWFLDASELRQELIKKPNL